MKTTPGLLLMKTKFHLNRMCEKKECCWLEEKCCEEAERSSESQQSKATSNGTQEDFFAKNVNYFARNCFLYLSGTSFLSSFSAVTAPYNLITLANEDSCCCCFFSVEEEWLAWIAKTTKMKTKKIVFYHHRVTNTVHITRNNEISLFLCLPDHRSSQWENSTC